MKKENPVLKDTTDPDFPFWQCVFFLGGGEREFAQTM